MRAELGARCALGATLALVDDEASALYGTVKRAKKLHDFQVHVGAWAGIVEQPPTHVMLFGTRAFNPGHIPGFRSSYHKRAFRAM